MNVRVKAVQNIGSKTTQLDFFPEIHVSTIILIEKGGTFIQGMKET